MQKIFKIYHSERFDKELGKLDKGFIDRIDKIGENGRQIAIKKWSWNTRIKELEKLLIKKGVKNA